MTNHDPRLTPARPDLAAARLRGIVEAERYVEGRRCQVSAEVLDLKRQPRPDAALDTQFLRGEILHVYDEEDGWAWVQAERDGYVGYVATHGLSDEIVPPTHQVVVNRTFVYPAPDMKQPVVAALPLAARVAVRDTNGMYAKLHGGGHVVGAHLLTLDQTAQRDGVAVAERLLGIPYLWGGRTPLGLDCSGLVQLSFAMAGIALPRDTHMQERFGNPVATDDEYSGLERGDLVFWPGHVGIMGDPEMLIHANGHHMLVAKEPLAEARLRIAGSANITRITSIRRLSQ